MRAAILYKPEEDLQIEEIDLQEPATGEVLVRVVASGICQSDHAYIKGVRRGKLPVILGHEGAGIIERVGAGVTGLEAGDHVIFLWHANCGDCFYCLRGKPALCEWASRLWADGTMLDGTFRFHKGTQAIHHFSGVSCFSEYTIVPQQGLLKIAKTVPLEVGALLGCSVTTGVGAVIFSARVEPGSSVLIIGAGGVGINAIQGAVLAGANTIIVADINPQKLKLARQFGATHTIDSRSEEVVDLTRQLTDGRGVDYSFEIIGRVETLEKALAATRKGGTCVMVGVSSAEAVLPLSPLALVQQEKTLKGCTYGSANLRKDIPLIIDLYLSGRLKIDQLISNRFSLDNINQAFAALDKGELTRGIISF